MAYVSKLQSGGEVYDVAPPPDLTDEEKAEYRSRIGAGTGGEPTAPIVMVDVTISQSAWSNDEVTITSSAYPVLANVTENSYVQFYSSDASANISSSGRSSGSSARISSAPEALINSSASSAISSIFIS